MTIFSKILGGHGPSAPRLRLWPLCALTGFKITANPTPTLHKQLPLKVKVCEASSAGPLWRGAPLKAIAPIG